MSPHHDEAHDLDVTRRDALKTLAAGMGAAAVIPLVASDAMARAMAARQAGGGLKLFTPAQHKTVDALAELIIPADDRSPGARAAKVADFLDFILSERPEEAAEFTAGLEALDAASRQQSGRPFAEATAEQQVALLTEAAKNELNPSTPLEKFFVDAKHRTIHAYYTSEIGIQQELRYKGNSFNPEFVGCEHPEHMA